jgi:fluoride ion exporter CrcB/FEX
MADTYRLFVEGAELLAAVYVLGATALGVAAAAAGWWTAQQAVPLAQEVPAL